MKRKGICRPDTVTVHTGFNLAAAARRTEQAEVGAWRWSTRLASCLVGMLSMRDPAGRRGLM